MIFLTLRLEIAELAAPACGRLALQQGLAPALPRFSAAQFAGAVVLAVAGRNICGKTHVALP
jgi:hypothetical protein